MDNLQVTPESIRSVIRRLELSALSLEEENDLFQVLESFECWEPLLRGLRRRVFDATRRSLNDYIKLARIELRCLENVDEAAKTLATLVEQTGMDYDSFRADAFPQVLPEEDFAAEATILEAICGILPTQYGRVACLERLCLIYEKKKYNDKLLNETYKRLIMIDSHNVKALRFFKVVYTQNSEWEEVSKILRALHTSARLEGDKHRYAQELATVYLYQLDRPKKAIEVIERHCSKSHLDTSTIQFEAYSRLGNWAGCLQVLKDCLLRVSDDGARGILFFKIGELEQQLGNTVEAINSFRQSNSLVPEFLDPIESLIEISLAARNWTETVANLNLLASRVVNVDSRGRIEEVKARLEGGIASAG